LKTPTTTRQRAALEPSKQSPPQAKDYRIKSARPPNWMNSSIRPINFHSENHNPSDRQKPSFAPRHHPQNTTGLILSTPQKYRKNDKRVRTLAKRCETRLHCKTRENVENRRAKKVIANPLFVGSNPTVASFFLAINAHFSSAVAKIDALPLRMFD
jgi:hypothetical protein